MSNGDLDFALALSLQELNNPLPSGRGGVPAPSKQLRVVDESLELSDPNPNIHQLFVEFDSLFFWGRLTASGVAVAWSPRMTLCAGVCSYEGRGGLCSIRLSQPLLKLRPRRDLVETLLHEMIHAFLFVTDNNKDHDGHGPEFLSHMHRINSRTGAKISVYHNFHREVKVYRQHWWKCDGPCQRRPPFYGLVKRATNRAPSPWDPWWPKHQESCGGVFRKIKEPEGYGEKKGKGRDGGDGGKGKEKGKAGSKDIRDLLKRKGEESGGTGSRFDSFKGRGHTVGGTGSQGGSSSDEDLRSKMLAAAERRRQENVKLRDLSVRSGAKRKLGGDHTRDASPRKRPHLDDSAGPSRVDADCIMITDTPPDEAKPLKIPDKNSPPPSVIVLGEEDTTRSQSNYSPVTSTPPSSPVLGLDDVEEFKTCPVCEMSNIPAAIINAHVSLCLEAEEQYRVIDDD